MRNCAFFIWCLMVSLNFCNVRSWHMRWSNSNLKWSRPFSITDDFQTVQCIESHGSHGQHRGILKHITFYKDMYYGTCIIHLSMSFSFFHFFKRMKGKSTSMYAQWLNSDSVKHSDNISGDMSDGILMNYEEGCCTLHQGSGMHQRFQVFCQPTAAVLGLRLLLAVLLPGKAHFSPSDPAKLLQLYCTWKHCISSRWPGHWNTKQSVLYKTNVPTNRFVGNFISRWQATKEVNLSLH